MLIGEQKNSKIEEDVQVQTGSEYLKQQNQLSVDTIKLSGAETYINRIATVKAEYTSNETLTETKTFDVPLRFYDEDGAEVSNDYVTAEFNSVQVTVPVLKVKQVPIKVEFTNIPDSWKCLITGFLLKVLRADIFNLRLLMRLLTVLLR